MVAGRGSREVPNYDESSCEKQDYYKNSQNGLLGDSSLLTLFWSCKAFPLEESGDSKHNVDGYSSDEGNEKILGDRGLPKQKDRGEECYCERQEEYFEEVV